MAIQEREKSGRQHPGPGKHSGPFSVQNPERISSPVPGVPNEWRRDKKPCRRNRHVAVCSTTTYFFLREQHLLVITGSSQGIEAAGTINRQLEKGWKHGTFWNVAAWGRGFFGDRLLRLPGAGRNKLWQFLECAPAESGRRWGQKWNEIPLPARMNPECVPDRAGRRAGQMRNPGLSCTFPDFVLQIEEMTELESNFCHNLSPNQQGSGGRYDNFGTKSGCRFQNCRGKRQTGAHSGRFPERSAAFPGRRKEGKVRISGRTGTDLERNSEDMTFLESGVPSCRGIPEGSEKKWVKDRFHKMSHPFPKRHQMVRQEKNGAWSRKI